MALSPKKKKKVTFGLLVLYIWGHTRSLVLFITTTLPVSLNFHFADHHPFLSLGMGLIEVDIELKTPADKVWSSIKDLAVQFPKIFPNIFRSIEILEGDGKSAGSLRQVIYQPAGEGNKHFFSRA